MTIKATRIKDLPPAPRSGVSQVLWQLSEPVDWGWEQDSGSTIYVVTSAIVAIFSGPETYIFPADSDGEIIDWAQLNGSYQGELDHEKAILGAGWEL